jgi:hypothetical protein
MNCRTNSQFFYFPVNSGLKNERPTTHSAYMFTYTITVAYDSSHIELLLDNESLTVFLLDLGLVSNR